MTFPDSGHVHPQYGFKAMLVILFVLGDFAINCFADHDDYTENGRWYLAVLFSIQCILQVVIFLVLFLMLVATYLFQVGLVTVLVSEFKLFSFIALAYLIALLAYGGEKMSLLYSGKVDRLTAWDHDAFYGLFVIHKMVAPAYYLALLHAVVKLGQPHWYNKAVWVQRFTSV